MTDHRIRERAHSLWEERADPVRNWLRAEREVTKPDLLVYLAAGATLDLGLPSTAALTNAILPALMTPLGYPDHTKARAHLDLTHPLKSTRRFREKRSVRTADT